MTTVKGKIRSPCKPSHGHLPSRRCLPPGLASTQHALYGEVAVRLSLTRVRDREARFADRRAAEYGTEI